LDREEFTSFYAASFHRLVGQLYAMTRDHGEAQDAVQEAFARAWACRGQLDRNGSPEAWVRVTAWRIAVSRWQRAREGVRLMLRVVPPKRPVQFTEQTTISIRPSALPAGAGVQFIATTNEGYLQSPGRHALGVWLVQASPACTGG
jgi:DNA-directed RNA polymerase specialized sigma24 family protein